MNGREGARTESLSIAHVRYPAEFDTAEIAQERALHNGSLGVPSLDDVWDLGDLMIVVVEGPSGAGKTTWVDRHHAAHAVWEYQATGSEPSFSDDSEDAAEFWAEANARRWQAAAELEARAGLAVCDTDPLKLHYVWTLWRIGEVCHARWNAEAHQARHRFETGRLGLADMFLVELPDEAELRHRKEGDLNRRRRNFELHARLADPLREWYSAVATLDPDRVRWSFPRGPLRDDLLPPRQPRTGIEVFDALVEALPAR